jgi:acyl-CoA synthetase (AMP-forming)/AMP-acid ligase II
VSYIASTSDARVMFYDVGFDEHVDAAKDANERLQIVIAREGPREGEHAYEDLAGDRPSSPLIPAEVGYDDPLWYFYTSGTTGRPKAAVLTHGQMAFIVANHLADLVPGTTEDDASLVVAPLSHGAGIHMLTQVARGARNVLLASDTFDGEEAWRAVEQYRVSNMFTVPTILNMLVAHEAEAKFDHGSLRHVIYAGAPMYREDQRAALEKLGTTGWARSPAASPCCPRTCTPSRTTRTSPIRAADTRARAWTSPSWAKTDGRRPRARRGSSACAGRASSPAI